MVSRKQKGAVFLFQPNNLAEHFIDHAAAFGKDNFEERGGDAGFVLENQTAVFHAQFVESFQFILQRIGEGIAAFDGVDGRAESLARVRRLAADESERLRLDEDFNLHQARSRDSICLCRPSLC